MATDKPKILFVVDPDLLERIDDYRFSNRIASRAEAMRRLLDKALNESPKKSKSKQKPDDSGAH